MTSVNRFGPKLVRQHVTHQPKNDQPETLHSGWPARRSHQETGRRMTDTFCEQMCIVCGGQQTRCCGTAHFVGRTTDILRRARTADKFSSSKKPRWISWREIIVVTRHIVRCCRIPMRNIQATDRPIMQPNRHQPRMTTCNLPRARSAPDRMATVHFPMCNRAAPRNPPVALNSKHHVRLLC